MGKKRKLTIFGKTLEERLKDAKKDIDKIIETEATFEDEYSIGKIISPTRIELIPKDNISVEDLHIKCVKRMMKRKVYSLFNCYINEDNTKVIMEK